MSPTGFHPDEPAFLSPQLSDIPEIDRIPGLPHPREMLVLLGQEAAERAFLGEYRSGRLHHAFLLTGPEGIGKATFAFRAARFLLAEQERAGEALLGGAAPETLAVSARSRAATLVANDAHPDLAVLKRRYDPKTKKFRSEIGVDDTREALSLFEKTAAFGGWRVIIVDSADDLNAASANALLKTLEEPPARAVFFLVAQQPQRLLATIRSRCRALPLAPLETGALHRLLGLLTGADPGEAAAQRANGSIRRALRLSDGDLAAYLAAIDEVLAALPVRKFALIDTIAEATRAGPDGEQALADLLEAIESWLNARIRAHAAAGEVSAAAALAEFWARMSEGALRLDAVNLDRRAFVITLIDDLAALVSAAAR